MLSRVIADALGSVHNGSAVSRTKKEEFLMGDTASRERKVVYFPGKGPVNTEDVARIVAARLEAGDIEAVVAATSTGATALSLAQALPKGTRVYAVNFQAALWGKHTRPDTDIQAQAEELGVVFMPEKPVAKYLKEIDGHSPDSLRLLGQGVKVAVEVVMQAVEVGHIRTGARVIGVGGSDRGADVALVCLAAGSSELSKLWVSEILAKPH